jgi:ketosteroid isomerase-like protein
MKTRLVVALVGLVISFALPTFAQQKDTVDPQTIQQLAALPKKFAAAFNNNDAAALAALYTEDAVLVNDSGPIYGREAIEKFYVGVFKQVHFSNQVPKPSSPHIIGTTGNEMWWNGEWSNTIKGDNWGPIDQKGYFADIVVREGDDWKVRLDIWNVTPPPAK